MEHIWYFSKDLQKKWGATEHLIWCCTDPNEEINQRVGKITKESRMIRNNQLWLIGWSKSIIIFFYDEAFKFMLE